MLDNGDEVLQKLAIKAMGNIGSTSLLSDLERIIKDKSAPSSIRTLAIYATKKMTPKLPKMVRPQTYD